MDSFFGTKLQNDKKETKGIWSPGHYFIRRSGKDISSLLTDTGTFSYIATVSLALHELFDNEWDREFNLQCISVLLNHLKLPKQV